MHATAKSFLVRKKTRDDEWMDHGGSTTPVSIGSSFSIVTCGDQLTTASLVAVVNPDSERGNHQQHTSAPCVHRGAWPPAGQE
jgi:hypothetical protein